MLFTNHFQDKIQSMIRSPLSLRYFKVVLKKAWNTTRHLEQRSACFVKRRFARGTPPRTCNVAYFGPARRAYYEALDAYN